MLGDVGEHARSVGPLPEPERSEVVRLVHDEQIPREGVGALEAFRAGEEVGEHVRLAQEVHRGDHPGEDGPRVRIRAVLALDLDRLLSVEDSEVQGELRLQLVMPLRL